jgi:hypothetical protein
MSDGIQEITAVDVDVQQAKSITTSFFNPVIWEQMKGMANTFFSSKAVPKYIENAAQMVIVLQAGLELGLKPVEAMNSLYLVNGSVNLWGKAITRQLRRYGYSMKYEPITRIVKDAKGVDFTDEGVRATVTHKIRGSLGNVIEVEEYVQEAWYQDAVASGYTHTDRGIKPGWKAGQSRLLKLRYMAISAICKTYIPEVLGSAGDIVEVAEDLVDYSGSDKSSTIQGEVIRAEKPKIENLKGNLDDFLVKNKGKKSAKAEENKKVEVVATYGEEESSTVVSGEQLPLDAEVSNV